MNNTDFRNLVSSTPRSTTSASPANSKSNGTFVKPTAPASLGSRKNASIPMTPRTVRGGSGIDFARQLAAHNAEQNGQPPAKKFKSAAAPRGARLAAGYEDRARKRLGEDEKEQEKDEREERIKALEEQMKLGQIERSTFEQLRDQITGGDVGATHLVKGLDRRLLERVRKGEDVMAKEEVKDEENGKTEEDGKVQDEDVEEQRNDAEDELEKLEQADLVPVQREEVRKKGEMAPPPPVAGAKRSRNDILAELKAQRKAAKEESAKSRLGSRFRRFGAKSSEPRIERDEEGREVLITVDENGRVKRKVRKVAPPVLEKMPMPDKASKPLGMVVPAAPAEALSADEDDDIFEGVGGDYNPLGPVAEDDAVSSESEEEVRVGTQALEPKTAIVEASASTSTSAVAGTEDAGAAVRPTNYFEEDSSSLDNAFENKGLNDPAIIEMLKRAAAAEAKEKRTAEAQNPAGDSNATAKPSSAAERLLARDRDLEDLDMGFGSSRFGDEEAEEGDGRRLKLSNWKGLGEEEDDEEGGERSRGGQQRKRGKKKRKGDKNSAADVMAAMNRNK